MKPVLLLSLLLLSGCGDQEEGEGAPPADINQIERLSTPDQEEVDPLATARLQPLSAEDIAQAGLTANGCNFRSGASLLLATGDSDSIARIGGRVVHLVQSSPVGPSGGFFEDRGLSISIGRTEAGAAAMEGVATAARATVTNRRTEAQTELTGIWSCRT